jgi:hypothetical protein
MMGGSSVFSSGSSQSSPATVISFGSTANASEGYALDFRKSLLTCTTFPKSVSKKRTYRKRKPAGSESESQQLQPPPLQQQQHPQQQLLQGFRQPPVPEPKPYVILEFTYVVLQAPAGTRMVTTHDETLSDAAAEGLLMAGVRISADDIAGGLCRVHSSVIEYDHNLHGEAAAFRCRSFPAPLTHWCGSPATTQIVEATTITRSPRRLRRREADEKESPTAAVTSSSEIWRRRGRGRDRTRTRIWTGGRSRSGWRRGRRRRLLTRLTRLMQRRRRRRLRVLGIPENRHHRLFRILAPLPAPFAQLIGAGPQCNKDAFFICPLIDV